ncbi:MAG: hypothetical protein AAB881_01535 [Patescibacteria group bacterium]
MNEFLKRPIVIGIFLVAILASIIWSYVDKRQQDKAKQAQDAAQQTEATQIVNLTNIDATDYDSKIKDELTLAAGKAGLVNSKYQLVAMEVTLPGSLLPNSGNDRFVYATDSDKANNWTITISEISSNYIRALIPKDDYLGTLIPINITLWKFNYVTALQIAEKNGGKDWREANSPSSVTLLLRHKAPKNWLTWTVEYKNDTAAFSKDIDANSGQIIEETSVTKSN